MKGIENYDRRRGWRGAITNTISNKNWRERISKYKLDPTLNWKLAEIISLNNEEIKFKVIDKKKSNLNGSLLKKILNGLFEKNPF